MKSSVAQSKMDKRIARIEEMLEALMMDRGLELPAASTGGESPAPNKTFASMPAQPAGAAAVVETAAERKAREKRERAEAKAREKPEAEGSE